MKTVDFANQYAKSIGFDKTYIPTEFIGLYEKYGYCYVYYGVDSMVW